MELKEFLCTINAEHDKFNEAKSMQSATKNSIITTHTDTVDSDSVLVGYIRRTYKANKLVQHGISQDHGAYPRSCVLTDSHRDAFKAIGEVPQLTVFRRYAEKHMEKKTNLSIRPRSSINNSLEIEKRLDTIVQAPLRKGSFSLKMTNDLTELGKS